MAFPKLFYSLLVLAAAAFFAKGEAVAVSADQYGAGEMKDPGRTFYVSPKGNDRNDGRTLQTAWRSVNFAVTKLQAGDTLEIAGGDYTVVDAALNRAKGKQPFVAQSGKPGAPIRIMGRKGETVVLRASEYFPVAEAEAADSCYKFKFKKFPPYFSEVVESPSRVRLQRVWAPELVKEYPGTYYQIDRKEMLVHFAAKKQKGIYAGPNRPAAFWIGCSYVIIENLTFEHYHNALEAGEAPGKPIGNITVRNCNFYDNLAAGITFADRCIVNRMLIEGNRGLNCGDTGLIRLLGGCENLVRGNWAGPSPLSQRDFAPYITNYSISRYNIPAKPARNLFIGNVLDNQLSFRWKDAGIDDRLEGNLLMGSMFCNVSTKPERVYVRNNYIGGKIFWGQLGSDMWEKNFAGTPIVFENNTRDISQFKSNEYVENALKLKISFPEPEFPALTFKDIQAKYVSPDSAAVMWNTPECDGVGSVKYKIRGTEKVTTVKGKNQGVRHCIGLNGLKPDTEYEYQAVFDGRRGHKGSSEWKSFRTAKTSRAPKTLYVGQDGMSLEEASAAVVPGDTVILKPGKHSGCFAPIRSGTKEHPITLKGEKGAVIDGQFFYDTFVQLDGLHDFVIEDLAMIRPCRNSRKAIISMNNSFNIVVRYCSITEKFNPSPFAEVIGRNILIENNLVCRGDNSIQVQGQDIVIRHNTIVNSYFCCVYALNVKNLEVTDNIFYKPCMDGKRNSPFWLQDVTGNIVADRNVHWSPIKEHPLGGSYRRYSKIFKQSKNLAEWQQMSGLEKNSIQADPKFVNAEKGDYRLSPGSPAAGKGVIFK